MFGKNRRAKIAAFAALITLGFIAFQGVTSAHNPLISANAVCIDGTDQARVTIQVDSWQTSEGPEHRTHNRVVLTVTAPGGFSQTYNEKFNAANNFSFTKTLQVPADGKTYTAKASTDEKWGTNDQIVIPIGPQSATTNVTVPMPCLPPPTSSTTTTTTVAPTSIAQPTTSTTTTTTTTTTTIPTNVQGVVETAPSTTAPPPATVGTAVQGVVLARTGSNTMPFVIGGVLLVMAGTAVELNARRRRTA